ncbi:MAG: hypothetical protein ACOYKR_00410 [Sphingobacterium thalpophilum]
MNKADDNYVYLINKIDGFIRKYYLNKVVKGSIFLASSLLAAYLIITAAEYWGHFDPTVRSVLFYAFILGNSFALAAYIIHPLLAYFKLGTTISYEQASSIIGRHFTPIKDKLLNTLQLKKLSGLNPEQRNLIDASINQKIAELRLVPFTSAIHINENTKYLKYLLVPLAIIVIVFFAAPSILSESTERLINYNKQFVKKAPFSFEILNDQLSVVQGADFTLSVKLVGNEIPADIYLEDGVNTFKLDRENIISFKHIFRNLQKSKKIILKAGEFRSEDYTLEVKAKPTLLDFDVLIEYPQYLNKANEKLENTGDLIVPEGSLVNWKFRAENSDQINLQLNKKSILLNQTQENDFTFSYRALKNLSYSIKPINSDIRTTESVSYELKIIPDLLPVINVKQKTDSLNSKLLYFVGQASDDHGFSKLNFNYKILSEKEETAEKEEVISIKFDKHSLQTNFFYSWNVNQIAAKPGEEIEYYFEVFDNDGVNGPKSVKSSIKTLKLPSELDLERKSEANSSQIKKKMEEAIKKSAQLEKETKKLNQELLNKKNLSFEERKQIQNLLNKQKEIDELVKEIQKVNKQNLTEQQEENGQILEKQKQIEELFNNVLDEKTREILNNIEKLLEKNNKNLTQEELSKMQMDNKSLQKELDRILELYKQLDFDQKLTNTIEKLNELAVDQENLSKKSQDKKFELEELKEEQKMLQKNFEELKEDLSELEQKNEELEQKNDFQDQQEAKKEIDKEQKNSADNLNKKDQKQASENQKKAAAEIKKLSKDLQSMQQENEEKENEVNAKSLRKILDNLIISSFDQEKTMQVVRQISSNDPNYIIQSQKQKEIQINLKMIEDSLYSLSKKVPQIQSVVNKEIQAVNLNIGKAIENLGERRTAEANRNQQFAMTSINNLALMLNEALEQLERAQQNGKAGGKGKQKKNLSQLSKMQDQLNNNMQKAREEMLKQGQQKGGQQGKTGREMSEQLTRMAREQQMIRQAMQEINKMENKDGKSSLGNLDKLMKEMEQTEIDLVNKRIQQETLNRQQEILSKLLDAEKADREREEDQKRESNKGITLPNTNSFIFQEFQKIKQKEIDLLKTMTPSLNSYYKIKVRDYFKYLNSVDK